MNDFEIIKDYLASSKEDAWIIPDYENRNPMTERFLGKAMLTRKLFLVFPRIGKPYLICHTIDTVFLDKPAIWEKFDLLVYKTWKEMLNLEKKAFASYKKVIMDISENGLLPRISLADYGSVRFIASLGIAVSSSGDLLQRFTALYDDNAYAGQLVACKKALQIKDEAFQKIGELIKANGETDEYTIQQFICRRFHEEKMTYDDPAIVAVNKNASNPHYAPDASVHAPIRRGDVVLIDMWAKMDRADGVYADITWMGYVGEAVPEKVKSRFAVLRNAVDSGVEFLARNLPLRKVSGYEVDDVVSSYIVKAGYGEYIAHRTGHNIAIDVSPHGPGVNIDDMESHDTREIIDGITFSLEPGIYAPDFGMRSETDCHIKDRKPILVGGRQEEVIAILKD